MLRVILFYVLLGFSSIVLASEPSFDLSMVLNLLVQLKDVFLSVHMAAFVIVGVIVGVGAHFIKDVKEGTLEGGIKGYLVYLFVDHWMGSLKTLAAILAGAQGYFAVNTAPFSWTAIVIAATTLGYSMDSLFNKGTSPAAKQAGTTV